MHRYFIELGYDGTDFHGWQIQNNANSIQATLNDQLTLVLREPIATLGQGRTDSGVHASQYFAHFDCLSPIADAPKLCFKLNRMLPTSIAIYQIFEVETTAHARFDAASRRYSYFINQQKNPFLAHKSFFYPVDLNIEAMNIASKILFQYTDYQCFSKTNTQVSTYNCTISEAQWSIKTDQRLQFDIEANRFLRNMVRAIVGTLLEVGKGKILPEDLHTIIGSKDRSRAGKSVPAMGLYLTQVVYPESIFRASNRLLTT